MSFVVAPSARRTPKSRTCCCTEYARMPNTPTIARTSASAGERDDQHGAETVTAGGGPRDVFERQDVADADQLLLVHAGDGRADRRGQGRRVAGLRAHDEKDVVGEILRHRHVDLHEVLDLVGTSLHLAGDADDLAHVRLGLRRPGRPQRHAQPDRRSALEAARERLVHDADRHTVA